MINTKPIISSVIAVILCFWQSGIMAQAPYLPVKQTLGQTLLSERTFSSGTAVDTAMRSFSGTGEYTLEVSARVNSATGRGLDIEGRDGVLNGFRLSLDTANLKLTNPLTSATSIMAAQSAQEHVIRIAVKNDSAHIYQNGNYLLSQPLAMVKDIVNGVESDQLPIFTTGPDLTSNWAGTAPNNTGMPSAYGWGYTGTTSTTLFANANSTTAGTSRYLDVNASSGGNLHTYNGSTYVGRLLYLRWDNATIQNTVYSYPVTLEANTTYDFSMLHAYVSNSTGSNTITVGIGKTTAASDRFDTKVFTPAGTRVLTRDHLYFTSQEAGTYYLTFTGNWALYSIGELSVKKLVPATPRFIFGKNYPAGAVDMKITAATYEDGAWAPITNTQGLGTIYPAGDKYDTNGNIVNAVEGGIIKVGSLYYLWGMDRSQNNYTFRGVNMYSSPDLQNWTFVNTILSNSSHPDIASGSVVERPKLLHNEATGQFVLWVHYEGWNAYATSEVGYATSSTVGGNYTWGGHYRPLGLDSKDMNVYKDTDGKAYMISSITNNSQVVIMELNAAYTGHVREVYRGSNANSASGFGCEGHAIIKKEGIYFLIESLCSGWDTNDNRYYTATSLAGPWTSRGNIAPVGAKTYQSQVTNAFAVTGSSATTFVYVGDRWSTGNYSMTRLILLPLQVSGTSLSLPWYDQWTINPITGNYTIGPAVTFNGQFTIVNRNSGKVMEVPGSSTADGTQIKQNNLVNTNNQRWTIQNLGGGEFRVSNVNSGKALEIPSSSRVAGTNAIQYTWGGGYNQKWHIIPVKGGFYRFVNVNTLGKTIEVAGSSVDSGAGVVLGDFSFANNQQWQILPVAFAAPTLSDLIDNDDYFKVTLSWRDINGILGSKYILERKIDGRDTGFMPLQEFSGYSLGSTFSYVDSVYTKATYRVKAFDQAGTQFLYSSMHDVLKDAVPIAPSSFTSTIISATRIQVNWNTSSTARSYNLKRSLSESGPWTTIAARTVALSYPDTALAPATTYYYTVTTLNSAGESVNSEVLSVTTPALAVPAVLNPHIASGDTRITLSWDFQYDAKYRILRSLVQNGTYDTIATNLDVLRYIDSNKVNSTTYYYKVIAYNQAGSGVYDMVATPVLGQHVYISFNESTGTFAEDVWGGYHGTLAATATRDTSNNNTRSLKLDGTATSYASLGEGVLANLNDFTIATWVKMDALSNWMRIFDFGTGTNKYMFLTPQVSVTGGMSTVRYAIKNEGAEQTVSYPYTLPLNTWTHFVVKQSGNIVTLYINGVPVATNTGITIKPADLGITNLNYIGKSQFADPMLRGSIDEFRIYNYALSDQTVNDLYLGSQVLPVQLTSFDGQATPQGNLLTWHTATELNNDYFVVERALGTPTGFEAVATVKGKGTSALSNDYRYFNASFKPNVYYYRLRQVNFDGVATHSKIISIENTNRPKLKVFPNPVSSMVTIELPVISTSKVMVRVLNLMGRQVLEQKERGLQAGTLQLDLSKLPSGAYQVQVSNEKVNYIIPVIKR